MVFSNKVFEHVYEYELLAPQLIKSELLSLLDFDKTHILIVLK